MVATRFVEHPRYRALILRRTFPQLQEIIDRCWTWYPIINPQATYRATEHRWYFPSGSTVQLGHMQHEQDKYNYQGKEFHFVGFDELTQFTETQYLYLHSRARSTTLDIPALIRATTNPGGIGHRWCKERFVDVAPPGQPYFDPATGQTRVFVPAKVTDNPTLMDADPGYIIRLKALPELERLRLLDGVWDVFEGQAFPELSQRVHGCQPIEVPAEWEKFCVFDWGYSKPFSVGWYALDYDGRLWRYREWYGCREGQVDAGLKLTPIEVARGILDREKEKIKFRVADPACWSKQVIRAGVSGPPPTEDMAKEGIFFLKADNNRLPGKIQVHQRLKLDEDVDPQTGEVVGENPRFYAFTDQTHFWRTMEILRLDAKNNEDVDTDQEDHCLNKDTLVYTDNGVTPIKELVGTIGKVLTVGGMWTIYYDCRRTRRDRQMLRLTFDDGRDLICTPDHKLLSISGTWIDAEKALTNDLRYVNISHLIDGGAICESKSLAKRSKSSTGKSFTSAGSIFSEKVNDFMGLYGNFLMGLFLQGATSTIKTRIEAITRLKILSYILATLISVNTQKRRTTQSGLAPCVSVPLSGMGVSMGFSGTGTTTKKIFGTKSIKDNLEPVIFAELLSRHCLGSDFAPMFANQNGEGGRAWILKSELALSAESLSPQTSTKSNPLVQELVAQSKAEINAVRVKDIYSAGRADTYCLVADATHAFAVQGGIVVSNCYDEFRYACMSRPVRPRVIPRIPPGTFAAERNRYIRAKKYAVTHGVSMETAYQRVR